MDGDSAVLIPLFNVRHLRLLGGQAELQRGKELMGIHRGGVRTGATGALTPHLEVGTAQCRPPAALCSSVSSEAGNPGFYAGSNC